MGMTKERKRLNGLIRRKFGYVTGSASSGMPCYICSQNERGEIQIIFDDFFIRIGDPDKAVSIEMYANDGSNNSYKRLMRIDELIAIGKIAEEVKKEWDATFGED